MSKTKSPAIEIRDSATGPQAYLRGTRLAVWWIVRVMRIGAMDAQAVASLYKLPPGLVQAALDYAEAHPEEITTALGEYDEEKERLPGLLPQVRIITVEDDAASA